MNEFLNGVIVATIVSIPSGPVGFLTAERVLTKGVLAGVFSALGVVFSDTLFAYLFTFSFPVLFHSRYHFIIHNLSAFLLLIVGVLFLIPRRDGKATRVATHLPLGDTLSAFLLVTLNPIQAMSFGAIIHSKFFSHSHSVGFVLGVTFGSAVLWGILISAVGLFRQHVPKFVYHSIHVVTGTICIVSALAILLY